MKEVVAEVAMKTVEEEQPQKGEQEKQKKPATKSKKAVEKTLKQPTATTVSEKRRDRNKDKFSLEQRYVAGGHKVIH